MSERLELVKWTGDAPPVGKGIVHRLRLLRWLVERHFPIKQTLRFVRLGVVNPMETPQCEEILVVDGGGCRVIYRRS
jgi:hypothetical protein